MEVYLPIAEMAVSWPLLVALGGGVGFLSGMFGVGGGFLIAPLLIFLGIPPAVAVASSTNQIVAASVSGALAHWRRGNVDVRMGLLMLAGGLAGSFAGVQLFALLRAVGQIDLAISIAYVAFLGVIGALMMAESVRSWLRQRSPHGRSRKLHQHTWMHGLPLKMRFRRSKLYISALLPLLIGVVVGVLVSLMGVGGGFVMVPAMIYLLGMPTSVVVGTSLFQIIFVTANVTFLQAYQNQTVDVLLALILLAGGVFGAQLGAQVGARVRGEQLRLILGAIVLAVSLRVGWGLVATPADLFDLADIGGRL